MLPFLARSKASPYFARLKHLFGSDLLAYYMMAEPSGSDALDSSGRGLTGAYTNVTLGAAGIGDGHTAAAFAGTGNLNCYSAALNAVFPGDEGSIVMWSKMSAAVWADATRRAWFFFLDNTSTFPYWFRKETDGVLSFMVYNDDCNLDLYSPEGFICLGFSWSQAGNYKKAYLNGILNASDVCAPDWAGKNLDANYTSFGGVYGYSGTLAHAMIIGRPVLAAEHLSIYNMLQSACKLTILADSISLPTASWVPRVRDAYNSSQVQVTDWGVSGAHVMNDYAENLTKQVGQAVLDDADKIIIELGTNDDNAGDMGDLQDMVETNLIALKASNPRATIYYMNVLPRSSGDKDLIRAAIAAGCAAQSVTCWDTTTSPWINPATDTTDGIHPNAAGHVKIATEVLTRL